MLAQLRSRLTEYIPRFDEPRSQFGGFEAGLLIVGSVGLTVMQFGGAESVFLQWFGEILHADAVEKLKPSPETVDLFGPASHPYYSLLSLAHWVFFCVLGYVVIPVFYLKLMGLRLRDYYIGFDGFTSHIGIYVVLFMLVILPVVGVSFSKEYQSIYPFYPAASRSVFDLVAWEILYGIQFVALEFFFRGFLLAGLKKWIGYGAVFVMLMPYCMLHFMKTGSESLGAVIAGVILGTLAMKYRSIWGGALIHWAVAISMDVLSLIQKGQLPTRLWP